ncbi:MAG TPA: NADH-quinone oxidoreductase subunit C [Streptosporangiaceae bacterium]|jgi:Ni,Fe-hydrogenase III large subunit
MPVSHAALAASVPMLWDEVTTEVAAGRRLADLFATARPDGLLLTAHLAGEHDLVTREALVPPGESGYPALTPRLAAAFWYEREIAEVFGVRPAGYPRPEPLLLAGSATPHVSGPGMFTIPHGPVRSGVMESIEYLVETPGEDIPHLDMRVFYKHRGIEKRFEGQRAADGVLLAERTEGIASVAHALAYCHAIEEIAGVPVPRAAATLRVLHAELERLACHLDVIVRLADGAGLAVATARFGWHKEQVLRLVGRLCGSRFGRGVVIPGGVAREPLLRSAELMTAAGRIDQRLSADLRLLMGTSSFLDRLRRTGPLRPSRATEHGALGPVGRASDRREDIRAARPYDGYADLPVTVAHRPQGDAMARLEVRVAEIEQSFALIAEVAGGLDQADAGPMSVPCRPAEGRATGWAEAPQGEVLYDVRLSDGVISRCRARSASFHNLVLMPEVFVGDILTDFPFIEASFGLSVAGVSR